MSGTPDGPGAESALGPRSMSILTVVFAVASGLAVANIYYAQPILGVLARSLHTEQGTATIVVTVTQVGYAAGLVLLLPLGDLVENRRLCSRTLLVTAVALVVTGAAPDLGAFLVASVLVGVTSVVAQILIPFAAHLAPDDVRGRVVGRINSGLTLGILLARTTSSLISAAWGWRAVFFISAGLMVLMSVLLRCLLPARQPEPNRYGAILRSVATLAATEPTLRSRALSQALVFAAFSAYWTGIAYELMDHHGFSQAGVGIFALVGATGAAVAPVAGYLVDRGLGPAATRAALLVVVGAMALAGVGAGQVALLGLAAVLLDIGMASGQVFNQHELYRLSAGARARINAVYMGSVFVGGAVGSSVTGILYHDEGWAAVMVFASVLPAVAFVIRTLTDDRPTTGSGPSLLGPVDIGGDAVVDHRRNRGGQPEGDGAELDGSVPE